MDFDNKDKYNQSEKFSDSVIGNDKDNDKDKNRLQWQRQSLIAWFLTTRILRQR